MTNLHSLPVKEGLGQRNPAFHFAALLRRCYLEVSFIRLLCMICLLSTSFSYLTAQAEFDQAALTQKADLVLADAIKNKDFLGVSAGIFRDKEIVYHGGAGLAVQEPAQPATEKMLHRIASIAKPMTAVAILQLEAAGKLSLDAPVQTYLSEFKGKNKDKITIRHLLTHTAGVTAYRSELEFNNTVNYPSHWAASAIFRDASLNFEPGKKHRYTTYGYVLLGAVIEKISGLSYAAYMRKNVWEPAGMKDTDIEESGKTYANKAGLYFQHKSGKFDKDPIDNLSNKYAGGGIVSTVDDLLRFGQALLDNTLISAEQLAKMQDYPKDIEWRGTPYGLGCYVASHDEFGRIIRHGGAQYGTSTYLTIYLDQRVVVAVLANTSGADSEISGVKYHLTRSTLRPETCLAPLAATVELTEAQLEKFVGTYKFEGGGKVKFERHGQQLWSLAKGYQPVKVFPTSPTDLTYRVMNVQFTFDTDKKGNIVKGIQTVNGKEIEVQKVK